MSGSEKIDLDVLLPNGKTLSEVVKNPRRLVDARNGLVFIFNNEDPKRAAALRQRGIRWAGAKQES